VLFLVDIIYVSFWNPALFHLFFGQPGSSPSGPSRHLLLETAGAATTWQKFRRERRNHYVSVILLVTMRAIVIMHLVTDFEKGYIGGTAVGSAFEVDFGKFPYNV
jgi:hypothetical protein